MAVRIGLHCFSGCLCLSFNKEKAGRHQHFSFNHRFLAGESEVNLSQFRMSSGDVFAYQHKFAVD